MTEESFRVCRICLMPEEGRVKFLDIFECNAKIATKIFNLAGILMVNVDKDIPSLICQKCVDEVEAAESLKMRILDADNYYTVMTKEQEIKLLRENLKLMQSNLSTPKMKSACPYEIQVRVKRLSLDLNAENVKPRKRKLDTEYDETLKEVNEKKVSLKQKRKSFESKATPNKLGIERMVIKNQKSFIKSAKSKIAESFRQVLSLPKKPSLAKTKPSDSNVKDSSLIKTSAKRKPFVPKLAINSTSKSKNPLKVESVFDSREQLSHSLFSSDALDMNKSESAVAKI